MVESAREQTTDFAERRRAMVEVQLRGRDIVDEVVLAAMARVPREEFVSEQIRKHAYEDRPLGIGDRQTISQPYIVALMTQLAGPRPGSRVLDVGTGCGYQAAVLAEIGCRVESVEIVETLADESAARLRRLGFTGVRVRHADATEWSFESPFDAIIAAAAPSHVPETLVRQLAMNGRLVIPVGDRSQQLCVLERTADGIRRSNHGAVSFVPMTGAITNDS